MQQVIPSKGYRRTKRRTPGARRTLQQAKTPVKQTSEILIEINKNEVERILRDIHRTPKKSPSTQADTSSTEKKRKKNPVDILHSNLSPKYIGLSSCDGKRSRYGRQQRTPSKLKIITSPGRVFEQKFVSYESPIEKLINKNKILANMSATPQNDSNDGIKDSKLNEAENIALMTDSREGDEPKEAQQFDIAQICRPLEEENKSPINTSSTEAPLMKLSLNSTSKKTPLKLTSAVEPPIKSPLKSTPVLEPQIKSSLKSTSVEEPLKKSPATKPPAKSHLNPTTSKSLIIKSAIKSTSAEKPIPPLLKSMPTAAPSIKLQLNSTTSKVPLIKSPLNSTSSEVSPVMKSPLNSTFLGAPLTESTPTGASPIKSPSSSKQSKILGVKSPTESTSSEASHTKSAEPQKFENTKKFDSPKLKKKEKKVSPKSSDLSIANSATSRKSESKHGYSKTSSLLNTSEVAKKINSPIDLKQEPEVIESLDVGDSGLGKATNGSAGPNLIVDGPDRNTKGDSNKSLVSNEPKTKSKMSLSLNSTKNGHKESANETLSGFKLVDNKQLEVHDTNVAFREMNKSPSANSTDSAKGSSIDLDFELPVVTGTIFWGRISTFPYWPCMVWPDPQGRTISTIGRNQVRMHVRFFADNGRRSWVRKADILPFNGKEEFDRRTKEVLSKYNKKHPNYRAFFISDRNRKLWERAISEANVVASEPLEMRSAKFNTILEETRMQTLEEKRKRRQSSNESRTSGKYSGMSEDTFSIFSEPGEYSYSTKRERSPTPESPAYEDIDDLKIFVKRRKLDLNGGQVAPNSKSSIGELSSEDFVETDYMFEDSEFKTFYDLIKSYTMVFNNDTMEKELYEHVKQIWLIRHTARKDLKDTSFNSILSTSEMNIRRLSSRMRTISKKDESSSAQKIEMKEKQKRPSKPVEEVVEDIMELNKNYLFKGLNREPVCKVCYKPSSLLKCEGSCQSWLHLTCITAKKTSLPKDSPLLHVTGDSEEHSKEHVASTVLAGGVLCDECKSGEIQECFVCKKNDPGLGERFKCHLNWCNKTFHLACLKYWPQAKLTKSAAKIESLLCPGHVCHTCVSDDPRGKFLQIDKLKLAKCVLCPATYHLDSFCIPAGTQFLTATNLICPRHRKDDEKKMQNVNANWCFICATGGSLICCETCPTSFHLECLKISQPEGSYICEECETGRLPLYGELVWAKLGVYRWWPALIIPPPEVPRNLMRRKHNASDFCLRFFGSNDHTWISRNRVFLYQEGDWGRVNQSKGIEQTYKNGLEEARRIFELVKAKKFSKDDNKREKRLTPLPYVKIKTNRPVPPVRLQEVDISELTACDCNPSDINPCGANSGCLNRLLLTECNPKICPAGEKCQNQMFEKRLYPALKVCRTSGKGWGLVCEENITAGDFIIEYVGEIIDDAEFKRRIAQKQEEKDENYYFLTLEKDHMIDAGPKGNLARFMNHSCEPNCETQKWNINGVTRVGLFAIKDVSANTELTFNYNLECIGDDKKVCYCGAEKCAGFIGAKYKEPEKIKPRISVGKKSKLKNATKKPAKLLKE